jgi:nitrite reductase (NO-forming)
MDRRTFFTVSGIGLAAAAVGARAVMAQDSDSTPAAGSATPGATPGASPTASGVIEVHTVDIAYEPTELTIPADTDVEIHVINKGMLEHDFNIEDTDFATDILPGAKEAEATLTVNLPAGEYVYFCSVPGHREAGMEGTLTVA